MKESAGKIANNMPELHRKNRIVALAVCCAVLLMVGLSFAAVPLYSLFCRVTGYGGTTQVAESVPAQNHLSERVITVKFDGAIDKSLPWRFFPAQREVQVHPGERALVAYTAASQADRPVAGTSLYNVSPPKAGRYFKKIECFCFTEQILNPGQEVSMPVVFFIDPAIEKDRSMRDVTTITLSYTFFETESQALDQALEDFYNSPSDDTLDSNI